MNVKMQIEHTESDGWAKLGQILLRWARNRSERRILENTDGQITDDGKEASNAPGPKLRALPAVTVFRQEKQKVKRLFYVVYAASYR